MTAPNSTEPLESRIVLDTWEEAFARLRDACDIPDMALAGWKVRVRHSKQEPFSTIGRTFKQLLEAHGAILRDLDAFDHVLSVKHQQESLRTIDTYLMVAGTANVSAEAMELAHEQCVNGTPFSARTIVTMPKSYGDGFIRKRLSHHGVKTELYEEDDVESGTLCTRALDHIISKKRETEMLSKKRNPRLGILTALPVEMEAVVSLLDDVDRDVTRPGGVLNDYTHGTLPSRDGGKHEIVVVRTGAGNSIAATHTERLFSEFDLDEVIMVGIAGGIPRTAPKQEDIRLGDIVVSGRAGVIQYDHVKHRVKGPQAAHQPMPPSRALTSMAESIIGSEAELAAYNSMLAGVAQKGGPFQRPSERSDILYEDGARKKPLAIRRMKDERRKRHASIAFEGAVGSANKVVKSQKERERVRAKYGVMAVEMEGAGVAEAAMANGKGFFVVRGICDYANDWKNDNWHHYAAMAAAVFAVHLIRNMPLSTPKTA